MSGVRGLQSYITKNAAARCRGDLKQIRCKSTKKRSKPRLLCDFSPVVDWLLSAYDAHLVETGHLSPYALLYGGDLKLYGQRIVAFVRALRHVGVVPVFFIDSSPGADVEHFEAQFPRLRSRHERMLERCAAVHRVCEGTGDILQVHWQFGQDALAEIAGCLQAEGVSLEHCTRGTAAEIITYQRQHSSTLGVLSTNTDFAMAADSKLFPLDFFDIDNSLGIRSANICPNPATLVCEWTDPPTLCEALQLSDERGLVDISVLCGNQFTAPLNETCEPCNILGLTSSSFECVSRWVSQQQLPCLDQMLHFDATYCDAISQCFEFYGYSKDSDSDSDGLPTNVRKKIKNKDYLLLKVEVKVSDTTIASIENGLYWRWPVLEPVSLGQLCFSDLTLPLRKKAYSVLGGGLVYEHGRTSTKSFTTVLVESEAGDSVCVREWSVTQRLVALFHLITELDADVHSDTFKDRVVSVASELDGENLHVLPQVVLVCASLCFLCHLGSQPGYHLELQELQALLMTCLFCSASISPHLMAEPPSSRALTMAMQFSHTLQQAQLLASTLCVADDLPLPSAVFYPMAYIPHYMASQVIMTDHQPSSAGLREAYHNYQWVLHTPPTSQLFEEIYSSWKLPNLSHLLKLFAGSTQYLQNHRAYLFIGSRLPSPPPPYLHFSFDRGEDDDPWGNESDVSNDDDLCESEVAESSEKLAVTPKSDHDWSEMLSSQDCQALEDFQYFSQDFGDLEGVEVGAVGEEIESTPGEGWEEVENVHGGDAESVQGDGGDVESVQGGDVESAHGNSGDVESVQGEGGDVESAQGEGGDVESVHCEGGEAVENACMDNVKGVDEICTSVDSEPQDKSSSHPSSQPEKNSCIISSEVEEDITLCLPSLPPSPTPSSSSSSSSPPSSSFSYSCSSSHQEATPRPSSQLQSPRLYGTDLPIAAHRRKLLELIKENRIVCVEGETGCGKSTRVPQYILDHALSLSPPRECRVLITQPRRMAAIKLAERVAAERRERLGVTVGYCVGGDHSTTSGVAITYCTTGYLLQALVHNPNMVGRYTHIILDEIHERSTDADFTLLVVRELLLTRGPNVKLVIMSATMQGSLVMNYLKDHFSGVAGPYFVGVKHYGVDTYFLDELDEIPRNESFWDEVQLKAATALKQLAEDRPVESLRSAMTARPCVSAYCQQVCTEVVISQAHLGESILVFLPGYHEIAHYFEYLQSEINRRGVSTNFRIFILHSQVPLEDQKDAFIDPPPRLAHVILATNIAESSITLPKLRVVVNFGIYRRLQYDSKRHISCLVKSWCSRASCEQRAGRAGRVFVGTVVHLFTRQFHDTVLSAYDPPEILTAPIAKLVLQSKQIGKMIGYPRPSDFLSRAIEPPSLQQMEAALQDLARLGAIESCPGKEIDEEADITFFGHFSLSLPVDLDLSRVVLYGLLFGCAVDAIVVAASMSLSQDVLSLPTRVVLKDEIEFRLSLERSYKQRCSLDAESYSDAIVVRNLFKKWLSYRSKDGKQKCSKYAMARRFCGLHACRLERLLQLEAITGEIAQKTLHHVPPGTAVYQSLLKLISIRPSLVSSGRHVGENESFEVEFCEDEDILRAMLAASFPHQLLYGVRQCESFNAQEKAASLGILKMIEGNKVDVSRTVVVSGGKTSSKAAVQCLVDTVLPNKFCQIASFGSTSLITLNYSFESHPLTSLLCNLNVIHLSTSGHEEKLVSTPLPTDLILFWQFGERRPFWKAGDISVNFSRPQHPLATSWFRLTKHKERVQVLSWRNPTGLVCEVDPKRKPLPFLAVAGHLQGFGSRSYVSANHISLLPSLHGSRNALLIALAFQPLTSKVNILVDNVNHRVVGLDINSFTLTPLPNRHYLDPQDFHNINDLRRVISEVFTSQFTSDQLSAHFLYEVPQLLSKLLSYGRLPQAVGTEVRREMGTSSKWERFLVTKEVPLYDVDESESESEDEATDLEQEGVGSGYQYLPPSHCSILQHLPEDSPLPGEEADDNSHDETTSVTCSLPGDGAVVKGGIRQTHSDTEVESKMTFKLSPTAPEFVPTTSPDNEPPVPLSDVDDRSSGTHAITDHSKVTDPIPAVSGVPTDLPLPLPTPPPMSPMALFKPQFLLHIAHLPLPQQQNIREHIAGLWKELLPKQSPDKSDMFDVLGTAHVDQRNKPDQSACLTGDLYGHGSPLLETWGKGGKKPSVLSCAARHASMHPLQQLNSKEPSSTVQSPVISTQPAHYILPHSLVTVSHSTQLLPAATLSGKVMGSVSTIPQLPVSQRPAAPLSPDHPIPLSRPQTNALRFPYAYTAHPHTHPNLSHAAHSGGPTPAVQPATLPSSNLLMQPSLASSRKPLIMEKIPRHSKPPMLTREVGPTLYFSKRARKPLPDPIRSKLDLSSRAPGARLNSSGSRYQARFPAMSSLPPLTLNPANFGYVPNTSAALSPAFAHSSHRMTSPPKIFPTFGTPLPLLHKRNPPLSHPPPPQPAYVTLPHHHTQYEAELADFIEIYLRKHGHWAELRTVMDKYRKLKGLPPNTPMACDWLAVCKDRFTMRQSDNNGIIIELKNRTEEKGVCSEERGTRGSPEGHVADSAETTASPLVCREEVTGEVGVREKETSPEASSDQPLTGPATIEELEQLSKDPHTCDIIADVHSTTSEGVELAEDKEDETAEHREKETSPAASSDQPLTGPATSTELEQLSKDPHTCDIIADVQSTTSEGVELAEDKEDETAEHREKETSPAASSDQPLTGPATSTELERLSKDPHTCDIIADVQSTISEGVELAEDKEDETAEHREKETSPAASSDQPLTGPATSTELEQLSKDPHTYDIIADVQSTTSEEVELAEDNEDETAEHLIQPITEGGATVDEEDSVENVEEGTQYPTIVWEEDDVGSEQEVEVVTHHIIETEYDMEMSAANSSITAVEDGGVGIGTTAVEDGGVGIGGDGTAVGSDNTMKDGGMFAGVITTKTMDIIAEGGENVTNGGDIIAEGGDSVTKYGNIVADDGGVFTKNDNIVADDGEIVTEDGNVIADGDKIFTDTKGMDSKAEEEFKSEIVSLEEAPESQAGSDIAASDENCTAQPEMALVEHCISHQTSADESSQGVDEGEVENATDGDIIAEGTNVTGADVEIGLMSESRTGPDIAASDAIEEAVPPQAGVELLSAAEVLEDCHISPPTPAVESNQTGDGTVATGDGAVATGDGAVATGDGAVATGDGAVATGDGAVVNGEDALMKEDDAVVMEDIAVATEGVAVATEDVVVMEGDTVVTGDDVVEGDTVVTGDDVVEGDTVVTGDATAVSLSTQQPDSCSKSDSVNKTSSIYVLSCASRMTHESASTVDFFVACLKLLKKHSHICKLSSLYRIAYNVETYLKLGFFKSHSDIFRVRGGCIKLVSDACLTEAGVCPIELDPDVDKLVEALVDYCPNLGYNIGGNVRILDKYNRAVVDTGRRHHFKEEPLQARPSSSERRKRRSVGACRDLGDGEERDHSSRFGEKPNRRRSFHSSRRRAVSPHFPKDINSPTMPGHISHILKFYKKFFAARTEPILYADLLSEYVSVTSLPSDFYLPSDLLKRHFEVYWEGGKRHIRPFAKTKRDTSPLETEEVSSGGCKREGRATGFGPTGESFKNPKRKPKGPRSTRKKPAKSKSTSDTDLKAEASSPSQIEPGGEVVVDPPSQN